MSRSANKYWWLLALLGILALTALQVWSAADAKRRTAELHTLLSDTQASALQLSQELGYGGLIHQFKNLVLRPGNSDQYRSAAQTSANSASTLISRLESNAAELV